MSVLASHFVELQSMAFSIANIILRRCFLRYVIVFDSYRVDSIGHPQKKWEKSHEIYPGSGEI